MRARQLHRSRQPADGRKLRELSQEEKPSCRTSAYPSLSSSPSIVLLLFGPGKAADLGGVARQEHPRVPQGAPTTTRPDDASAVAQRRRSRIAAPSRHRRRRSRRTNAAVRRRASARSAAAHSQTSQKFCTGCGAAASPRRRLSELRSLRVRRRSSRSRPRARCPARAITVLMSLSPRPERPSRMTCPSAASARTSRRRRSRATARAPG